MDFPIIAKHVFANLLLALHHDRQRRRLHAAYGGQKETAIARVKSCHGAGAVNADQPIGLRAAACSIRQRQHLLVGAQVVKAVANSLRRHALQPQAGDGFAQRHFAASVLLDQTEDQLALAARVTGVDNRAHVFALGQLDHGIQAGFSFVYRL